MVESIIDVETANELFSYNKDDGSFLWKKRVGSNAVAGSLAGWQKKNGSICVMYRNSEHRAHQIVWLMNHGEYPPAEILPVDGDYSNLRCGNWFLKPSKEDLSNQETLLFAMKSRFVYNRYSGKFSWLGKVAPSRAPCYKASHDYLVLSVFGVKVYAHRAAYMYEHGGIPAGMQIDHINGDRSDNRIKNLRCVDERTNRENQRSKRLSNKSTGLLGCHVHKETGKFRAQIKTEGKKIHIGLYDTAEQAHAAYLDAKRILHAGCTI